MSLSVRIFSLGLTVATILSGTILLSAASLTEPVVTNREGFQTVFLKSDVKKAIKKLDPNFRMFQKLNFHSDVLETYPSVDNQLPQAVKADLNGDGIQDIVVMGKTINNQVVIHGVLSTPKGYVATLINRWSEKDIKGWDSSDEILKGGTIRNWPFKLWLAPDGQIRYLNAELQLGLNEHRPHIKYSSGTGGMTEGLYRVEGNRFREVDTRMPSEGPPHTRKIPRPPPVAK